MHGLYVCIHACGVCCVYLIICVSVYHNHHSSLFIIYHHHCLLSSSFIISSSTAASSSSSSLKLMTTYILNWANILRINMLVLYQRHSLLSCCVYCASAGLPGGQGGVWPPSSAVEVQHTQARPRTRIPHHCHWLLPYAVCGRCWSGGPGESGWKASIHFSMNSHCIALYPPLTHLLVAALGRTLPEESLLTMNSTYIIFTCCRHFVYAVNPSV